MRSSGEIIAHCRLTRGSHAVSAPTRVLEGLAAKRGRPSFHALGGPEREQILSSTRRRPDGPRVWRGVPWSGPDAMSSRSTGLRVAARGRLSSSVVRLPRLCRSPSGARSPNSDCHQTGIVLTPVVVGSGARWGFAAVAPQRPGSAYWLLERGRRFDPRRDFPMNTPTGSSTREPSGHRDSNG